MLLARTSYKVAVTAMMASLVVASSLLRLEIPFYPLTYLKFDIAEIPSVMAFLLAGPCWGYLCALVHFLGLVARGGDPLGASMKLAAVASMLLGLQLSRRRKVAVALSMGIRSATMSAANFLVLSFLFPHWMNIAVKLLRAAGISVGGWGGAMALILLLTAIFNCIHVILSVAIAAAVVEGAERRLTPHRRAR